MTTFRTRRRLVSTAGGLMMLLATAALGADPAPQTVDVGGATFQAPAAWKSTKPTSPMRKAQLKVEAAKGDAEGAELIVFVFPGGAGSVESNIQRWEKTFKDKDGNSPKAAVKKVKGKNIEVNRVELAGHYYPTAFPGQPKQPDHEKYQLLGAIVTTDEAGYFLRLVGPEKTVSEARNDFDKLIESIKVGGK